MGVHAHRAGPVERTDGGDVLELVGPHRAQQRPHRAAVELEDAEGVAPLQQGVRRPVVEGEVLEDHGLAAVGLDVLEAVVEDRQVAQAQEVHLDQAQRLARRVVELGDHGAVGGPAEQRDHVDERLARHDHAGGVHAPLALEALDADRGVDHAAYVGVGLHQRPELAALAVAAVLGVEDLLERDVLAHHRLGHGLGDPVAHREGVAEDARGVLDRLLGLDRPVGDDHRDAVLAVLVGDVLDDLAAATLVEVDVEVGHRDAVGVEEPLEQQAVDQRVQVGDPHRVGDDRARTGATPGADADAVVLGPVDEVGDHQEVAAEAHLGDDVELELGTLAGLVGDAAGVADPQAALDLLDHPGRLVLADRTGEPRHVGAVALGEADVAALGDEQGVVAGLRQAVSVGPQGPHLGRGLEVVVGAGEGEALARSVAGRDVHRRAGVDAEQVLLRRRVLLVDVVGVVGGEQRDLQVLRQPEQTLPDPLLQREVVVHQLQEVALPAEDVLVVGRRLAGRVVVAVAQVHLHLARRAARGGDDALAVLGEQVTVDPGLLEEAVAPRPGREPEQVVHALGGLREQRHVGVGAPRGDVVGAAVVEVHAPALGAGDVGGRVGLHPDDRLDPRGLGHLVELVGAEDVAVVGHRDRRHPEVGGPLGQGVEPGRAVEHGVLGVDVQVDEGVTLSLRSPCRHECFRAPWGAGVRAWQSSHGPGAGRP